MPCYTAWYEHYVKDSPEYLAAKQDVMKKLNSVKHIIDYYYQAHEFPFPDVAGDVEIDPMRQPKSRTEIAIRHMICHHFACDGVDVSMLYDAATLPAMRDERDRSYAAIILPCATLMRKDPEKYLVSNS